MGIVYIAALILGLGTTGLQFLLSHAGAGDHDIDAGGHDGDMGHADTEHGGDHDGGSASGLAGAAAMFLSMRFWTFALMAFGMVGTALHYLALCGFVGTLVLAGFSGLVSGFAAAAAFRALKAGVSSSETSKDAVGRVGRVLVPMSQGHAGKVRIQLKGKTVDVLATADGEIGEGDEVLVLELEGTTAHVERFKSEK